MNVDQFIDNIKKDEQGHVVLNLIDNTILHTSYLASALRCSAPNFERDPDNVRYVNGMKNWDGITVFTDKTFHLAPQVNSPVKIAWVVEPYDLLPQIYDLVAEFEEHYDFIFTYEKTLLDRDSEKYKFFPCDTSGIEIESHELHKKTKLVSMIYSEKTWLFGHRLRHIIAKSLIPEMGYKEVDFFGRGTDTPIVLKSEGTNPYMFQITTENAKRVNYFTDKIYDCFVAGTVPIYWGAPNIDEFFDMRGILSFNHPSELKNILLDLNPKKYEMMYEGVVENFKRVKHYLRPDDFLYESIIKHLKGRGSINGKL
tara:strand:+ start:6108 stop:7043 length:936 start_codon:yes stop_codon:yes gene_type:complete